MFKQKEMYKMTSYNHLKDEESPYLKQHVDNPVNWYPWGEKAFKKAKEKNMPIFLSIGYSTCHWCHVMEEESFTDKKVAEIINKNFVAVKVDREERPDIDKLYMEVCKIMTGGGGWPLTIFMTPDKKPFHVTTYLPKNDKYGRKGLLTILPEIINLWENKRVRIEHVSNNILSQIKSQDNSNEVDLKDSLLTDTISILERMFDDTYGGFGNTPKFPMSHYLLFLLRYWDSHNYSKSINMVQKTLEGMRTGGIYDQIGFGFHRYSTDRKWQTPHFEKMLYDQALLIFTYIETYQVTNKKIYRDTAKEVIKYLQRDMLSTTDCFYAAEDADSDGVEGKYYLWEEDELKNLLNPKEFVLFEQIFTIENSNHINLILKDIDYYDKIPEIKEKLFKSREKKNRPRKDNKILTDWNGLTIAALAKAGFVLNSDYYIEMAAKAAKYIYIKMRTKDNRLAHSFCNGKITEVNNLDDYSYYLWGLIELYQATFNKIYLAWAVNISDEMIKYFWDNDEGGFYYTSTENSELFLRQKEGSDSAIPSSNSLAAYNLLRLSHITDDWSYKEKAEKTINAFSDKISKSPINYIFLLLTYYRLENPFVKINIIGNKNDDLSKKLIDNIRDRYLSNIVLNYEEKNEETKISICQDFVCKQPTTNLDNILKYFD